MFHPSYQRCLLEYLRSTHTSNHSGLLLGAITTETIREFAQTVRGVYPGAELTTVDIESPTKFRNPDGLTNFVRCDALVLARRSVIQASSIDTVHTNVLLPHLKGTDNLTTEGARQKLFEGIFSTLRPQGMAILVEFVSTPISSPETLRGAAESVGLTDIDSQPAQIFRTRRGMDRFFRGSNLSASQSEIVTLPSMHVFSARKP